MLAETLIELECFFEEYLVLPSDDDYMAITLWTALTWADWSLFDSCLYLALTSPEKEAGKTRTLECLEQVVKRPWLVTLPSASALFSKMEQDHPTVLLDEVDAIFSQKGESAEAMRGVLNAGNRRGGTVSRVQMHGTERVVQEFGVFGPKALAGISSMPETLDSRSLVIPMKRKRRNDQVSPFRAVYVKPKATELREKLAEDVKIDEAWLRSFDGEIDGLSDRQAEGWAPMLALAGEAGGKWLFYALRAARVISARQKEIDTRSYGRMLLLHVQEAFGEDGVISTHDLLYKLRQRDDGPWAERYDEQWDVDDAKSAARLGRDLKEYGIQPRRPRIGGKQVRGYVRSDFTDAWARYL